MWSMSCLTVSLKQLRLSNWNGEQRDGFIGVNVLDYESTRKGKRISQTVPLKHAHRDKL